MQQIAQIYGEKRQFSWLVWSKWNC